jgi:hypothetical protein
MLQTRIIEPLIVTMSLGALIMTASEGDLATSRPVSSADERAVQLTYAPPSSLWYLQTRHVRRAVWLLIVLVLIALVRQGQWHRRLPRAYWAWRCANYSMADCTVVIESDPAKAQALLANNPNYERLQTSGASVRAAHVPAAWKHLIEFDNRVSGFRQFARDGSLCYLGERRSPNGTAWLVAVSADAGAGFGRNGELPAIVLARSSFIDKSPAAAKGSFSPRYDRHGSTQLLPGHADPADKSHFQIPYHIRSDFSTQGQDGVLDGSVRDDGTIRWAVKVDTK